MNATSAATEKKSESCQTCALNIKDGRAFRCGFDYFQVPPSQRRPPKLTSFPEVAASHSCPRWDPNGSSVLKPSAQSGAPQKSETVYYLPGWGGLISTGLGQALLDKGYDVTGRETVGEFKSAGFTHQVEIVANDLKEYFWRENAHVICNSFGGYLFLHAQALIGEPYVGNVILLAPIIGEFADDDEVRPMNFIPPQAEKLLELATAGKFPVPVNCQIHVGSEDWQSCPNAVAFGKLVGMKVNVVEGAGHGLPKDYVSKLLDQWSQ
jgi:pimeloyl-ACP methyl ester carboxylesterase